MMEINRCDSQPQNQQATRQAIFLYSCLLPLPPWSWSLLSTNPYNSHRLTNHARQHHKCTLVVDQNIVRPTEQYDDDNRVAHQLGD